MSNISIVPFPSHYAICFTYLAQFEIMFLDLLALVHQFVVIGFNVEMCITKCMSCYIRHRKNYCYCVVASVVVIISGLSSGEKTADLKTLIRTNLPAGVRMMMFDVG